jgi:hypothetical protein
MPTTIGPAGATVRAHSSGDEPVEFSGTARARPVQIAHSLFDLPSVALRVIGLGVPAISLVQVLVPVCGPPM